MRRRLRADGGALRGIAVFGELELELLGETDELLELALDELGVAGDAAAQRFAELANGAQLLVRQALRAQLVAERQKVARCVVELLLHFVDRARVVPEPAIARIPDAAAPPVGPVARSAGAEAAVAIADLAAGIRLRVTLPGLTLLTFLARLTLTWLARLSLLPGLPLPLLLARLTLPRLSLTLLQLVELTAQV